MKKLFVLGLLLLSACSSKEAKYAGTPGSCFKQEDGTIARVDRVVLSRVSPALEYTYISFGFLDMEKGAREREVKDFFEKYSEKVDCLEFTAAEAKLELQQLRKAVKEAEYKKECTCKYRK